MYPELSTLLDYKNNNVLNRYSKDYPDNRLDAEKAFRELMKFIWLNLKHKSDKKSAPDNKELDFIIGIHHEMKEIDDMWHTFLLFTKDYADFCEKYIGKYFHHSPNNHTEEITKSEFETDFTRFLSYVYDNLQQETLEIWFHSLINKIDEKH